MEWVETTGRTVAEALDKALDQLGVDEQEAEVQVLEEPQKGLFGRLRGEARVRARVRPTRPRPKMERRDRRRRGDRDRERRGRSGGGSGAATKTEKVEADASGNGSSDRAKAPAGSAGGSRKRRRRGGSGTGGSREAKHEGAAVTNQTSEEVTQPGMSDADMDGQRVAVEEFLRGLVDAFGRPEATVSVQVVEDDTIEAEVNGEELGLLVGPKGQTLQSVHELVRSMVQRRFVGEAHARVRVDVAGYRQRRREALERFTRSMAEQVVSSGRPVALDPMGASDRKVVHDMANEIDGVQTISEGEEPARRVIIQPS